MNPGQRKDDGSSSESGGLRLHPLPVEAWTHVFTS